MQVTTRILLLALSLGPSSALAGGLGAPTVEQEPSAPAPAVTPSQGWTGFYLGAQATSYSGSDTRTATGETAFTFDGVIGGLHAGYNHDFGRLVLGGELSVDAGNIGYVDVTGLPDPFSLDRVVSLKLKAGIDMGKVLAYGTIGKAHASFSSDGVSPFTTSANGTLYGVGMAVMLSERLMGSAEILKYDFDPYQGAPQLEPEATSVSLRVSYRF